ncbi:MAG: family 10 glycosylhydrolase [Nitrospiraceae bacterium]|nr:family 10 glycosylhydrolase [Nitrospiraceae bacterium]
MADGPPPLPASAGYPVLSSFEYNGNTAARAAWAPQGETAPVSLVQAGSRQALYLHCNLAGNDMPRASWDWKIPLNLATSRGLRFRFFCADASAVSRFQLYLHSGGGWYCASFSTDTVDAWTTVYIDKADTWIEDRPSGWAGIDSVRISAWRGGDADADCYIADFGVWDTAAPLAVLRQESSVAGKHSEMRLIEKYAAYTSRLLDDLGLPYVILSDLDLSVRHLRGIKTLVLPYCPDLSTKTTATLSAYLARGGNLVSFYILPESLQSAAGFKKGRHIKPAYEGYFTSIRPEGQVLSGFPASVTQRSWNIGEVLPVQGRSRVAATWYDADGKSTGHAAVLVSANCVHMTHVLLDDDPVYKRMLLLAMVGHFLPEYWELAAKRSMTEGGAVGPYATLDEALAGIQREAQAAGVAPASLKSAAALRKKAATLAEAGQYPEAVAESGRARDAAVAAFCDVQQSQPGEFRAFWCHNAFGVTGMTWDEAIKRLADNGFTAVLPNMLWGGTAYYDSRVLPVAPEVGEQGDQIAACLAACKKYGVECHVWKVNWNTGGKADKAFVDRMRKAGRIQVMFDGTSKEPWLCPSHPANQQLEIDAMVEVATKYDVDGIHFDYIRYPHSNACFCRGCRKRFEKRIGVKVANWPSDVRTNTALKQRWLDFRRDQITKVVAGVSQQVRKRAPGVKISAAVFRNWPSDRDSVGQDWKLWCEKGYLDFVCPMDYTPHNVQFDNMIGQQQGWAGNVPCYPGIGLSTWADPTDVANLIEQIKITRRRGTGGFTVFNYGVTEAERIVPLCGRGITKE